MTITTDIGQKLQFINDSFFASTIQNELLGNNAGSRIGTDQHFMKSIFNYDEFILRTVPATLTIDNTLLNKIYLKKGTANYAPIRAPVSETYTTAEENTWILSGNDYKNSEYNYSELLSGISGLPTAFGSQFGSPKTLLEILNIIRVAYNILDPDTYVDYYSRKQAGETTLSRPILKYSINTTTNRSVTENNISAIETLITPIIDLRSLDTNTSRIEMIRRILYLYDVLLHINLSFYLLEKGQATTKYRVILYTIAYNNIKFLFTRNDLIEEVGGNISIIQKDMQNRINTYNLSKGEIERHANLLKDNQSNIKIEQSKLDVRKYQEKKISVVYYIYFAVFLVCLVSIGSVVWNTTLSDNIKRLIVSILGGLSILGMVILYLVNRYSLENFAGAVTISAATSAETIKTTTDFNTTRTNLLEEVLKACYEYLSNTINVGLLINTYTSYGEMNYSIQKEKSYYDDKNHTLQTNQNLISHASNVIDLENKTKRYRVYYFIQILITISVSAILVVYLPESSSITSLILIIASILIIFFTYIYIVNVNNLVRTDASKIYWGQPDPKEFLY